MTKDEIIRMAREAGFLMENSAAIQAAVNFAHFVAAAERAALEAELLKLKKGIAANREYIQGRWDLIGEFQDAIRTRGNT